MIGCRHCHRIVRVASRFEQVARRVLHQSSYMLIKTLRPCLSFIWHVPLDTTKIVNDIAACDYEDPRIAQRCKPVAEVQVIVQWFQRVD